MNISDFLTSVFTYFTILPAAVLCLAPVHSHFRFKRLHTYIVAAGSITLLSIICSLIEIYYSPDFNTLYLPVIVLLFFAYHNSINLHISQSLSIFMTVVTVFSFLVNFSIIYDALRNPDLNLTDFSLSAAVFQLAICILFSVITCYPIAKYGSFLIDYLQHGNIWMVSTLISSIFFLFNLRMVIHYYSTLHTNMVGIAYITVMIMLFVLFQLLCVIFYFIVNSLHKKAETDARNRILEMQEKQYTSLQKYLDADARIRHDFRQTIYTLKELSANKDYQAIDEYLNHYYDTLPQRETTDFCKEPALNALLNHYDHIAREHGIRTYIQVLIPSILYINNTHLCSIVGNIFENAITACSDIPEDKRLIHIVISEEQRNELYIAISNSYSRHLRQKKSRYLSTHKNGSGIGLLSITSTAERYNGTASFSHDDEYFYSNIMMMNKPVE